MATPWQPLLARRGKKKKSIPGLVAVNRLLKKAVTRLRDSLVTTGHWGKMCFCCCPLFTIKTPICHWPNTHQEWENYKKCKANQKKYVCLQSKNWFIYCLLSQCLQINQRLPCKLQPTMAYASNQTTVHQ